MAPSLQQTIEIAGEKAYVILDRSLLRKDQVATSSDRDRPFCPPSTRLGVVVTACRVLDAVVKRADSGYFAVGATGPRRGVLRFHRTCTNERP